MSYQSATGYKRRAVLPVVCLKEGWNLIRDQYWLFVGIAFVGIILAGMVPMAIILGPMMCGIYICLFRRQRGEPVEFGDLFKGFDYFGPSLIATLFHILPVIVILIPIYLVIMLSLLLLIPLQRNGQADVATVIIIAVVVTVMAVVIAVAMIVLNIAFTFAYPLIVDRKLSAFEAVKLSARAGMANFWQILVLMLLNGLLGLAGLLLCYFGVFLVLPVNFASLAIAYVQVFGLGNVVQSPGPPPPPRFT